MICPGTRSYLCKSARLRTNTPLQCFPIDSDFLVPHPVRFISGCASFDALSLSPTFRPASLGLLFLSPGPFSAPLAPFAVFTAPTRKSDRLVRHPRRMYRPTHPPFQTASPRLLLLSAFRTVRAYCLAYACSPQTSESSPILYHRQPMLPLFISANCLSSNLLFPLSVILP